MWPHETKVFIKDDKVLVRYVMIAYLGHSTVGADTWIPWCIYPDTHSCHSPGTVAPDRCPTKSC